MLRAELDEHEGCERTDPGDRDRDLDRRPAITTRALDEGEDDTSEAEREQHAAADVHAPDRVLVS